MTHSPEAHQSPTSTTRNPKLQLPPSCNPPTTQNPPKQKVWVVFGGSGHMGRSVVKAALNHNDLVTAVGKTFEDTPSSMALLCPSSVDSNHYQGMLCDVRVPSTVSDAIDATLSRFGRLDIVANCSGYGVIGACEDQDESDVRNQFETNFFGTLNIIQATLPYFRTRTDAGRVGGRYLIFSSTSGALGVPGLGPYCATKYAVEGLIESMLYEIDAFDIKATLVEPGHVRRDEPLDVMSSPLAAFGHFFIKPASDPYAGPTAPAAHAKRMVQWLGDKQPTSAVKSAELVWQLAHCQFPPLRLLLGSYAVESVRDRLRTIIEEIEDWKHLNFSGPGGQGGGEGKRLDGSAERGHGGVGDDGDGEGSGSKSGEGKREDDDEAMGDYSDGDEDGHGEEESDDEHGSHEGEHDDEENDS